jgi:hypothetical protein
MKQKSLLSHPTLNDDFNDFLEDINDYNLVDMSISKAIDYLQSFEVDWLELPVMDADTYDEYTVSQLISILENVMSESDNIKISELYICNFVQYINFEFQLFKIK